MTAREQAIFDAAKERASATLRAADRPRQRRCAEFTGSQPRVLSRAVMTLRDAGGASGAMDFSGYASVTNNGYEMYDWAGPYTELVNPGAFQKTLAQPDLDVPLVLNHDSLRRMARTTNGSLQLSEDDNGLLSQAPSLDPTDADVAYIAPKIRSGLIDEMSFRFMITSGQWSPDWTEFHINEVDIDRGDVSIVGYGANPATTAQLRSITQKLRTNRALDAEDVNMLTQALGWISSIDTITTTAQASLATYLQVPNPDPDAASELAAATEQVLREREQSIRREIRRRGLVPAMTREEAFRF